MTNREDESKMEVTDAMVLAYKTAFRKTMDDALSSIGFATMEPDLGELACRAGLAAALSTPSQGESVAQDTARPVDEQVGRRPVGPFVFKDYLDDFAAFVAGKAPDLHWAVSGAAGAEGLYEGGFDGYRHGFGMTALKPRPLPDLMAEMKNALLRALAATEGSVSPHIEGENDGGGRC